MFRTVVVRFWWSFLFLSASVLSQRSPDVRLNTNPPGVTSAGSPRLEASGSSIYAVWSDYRNGQADVYFNTSADGGATWLSSDLRLDTDPPGSVESWRPQIAATGSAVYVAWLEMGAGGFESIYFNRSLDRGRTWLNSAVRLDTPLANDPLGLEIAASGSAVYVTWGDSFWPSNVYFNRSLDGGTTWLPSERVLNTVAPAGAPKVAASGQAVFVVWVDGRLPKGDIYFTRSLDQGTTWLASQVRLDTDPAGAANSTYPEMTVMGTSVYVAWNDQRNGTRPDIYFNGSTDSGTTWLSSDVRLNTDPPGTESCGFPQMATTGSSVYVAWDLAPGSRLSEVRLNCSKDSGATWLASDLRMNTNPPGSGGADSARIAASGSSVYVTWRDTRNAFPSVDTNIYVNYSTNGGATWLSSDVQLDMPPMGASTTTWWPDVVALTESAFVAWGDFRSGTSDIYSNLAFAQLRYGTAKAGSGGLAPRLSGSGAAVRGGTAAIDVDNALGGAAGTVLIGAGPASMASVPLFGGTLLVIPGWAVPIALGGAMGVPGAGAATLPLSIPAVPALGGQNLNFQALILDGGATFGVSMTNAVEMWIG